MKKHVRVMLVAGLGAALSGTVGTSRADTVTVPAAADTFINSGNPTFSAGGHPWFDAGADGQPTPGVRRGLLQFDLTSLPAGATVTSAVVRLTATKVPAFGPVDSTFDLRRLLAGWGEGTNIGNSGTNANPGDATWTARILGTANWTVAGALNDATASASASTPVDSTLNATYSWSGADLVSDVQLWLSNPSQNFGWLLTSQNEGTARTVRGFAARESGASAPALQIGYTPAANLPPSVTITNPLDNAVFGNTFTVTIEASANDPDGSVTNVQFFDGVVSLGSDSTSPYSFSTRFALGSHTLTAVASDNLGVTTTSAPIHVTVARYLPAITNGTIAILLRPIATGMAAPDYAISPPGDTTRLFVVEQNGLLRVIQNGTLLPGAALDIQSRVQPPLVPTNPNDERGFLGLAFHPGFNDPASPGYRTLYTYNSEMIPAATAPTYPVPTTATNNYKIVVNEWKMSATDTNVVDPASRREVISFGKTAGNHNGGTITFGPDNYLYLALGDGGNAHDVGPSHVEPGGNAQNLSTPLGKMLRFDPLNPALTPGSTDAISANGQYRIPTTNPFQGPGQVPEIYAYGLRNPYRFSFDRANGELIQADVGQNNIEEIDRIVLGGNYGWAIKEGDFLFNRTNGPAGNAGTIGAPPGNRSPGSPAGLIDPISGPMGTLEYDHNEGISITGGFVYRGTAIPELVGKYIFGDLALKTAPVRADGRLFYADLQAGTINAFPLPQFGGAAILPNGLTVHGFGEDADGELYALVTNTSANGTGGIVYKLLPLSSNLPPSVAISNPIDGAVFAAPANVTIMATASDTEGSVTNVQFFDGTSSLSSVASAPYNLTVNLGVGSHPLTAIATDNLGASSTSAVVNVTVTTANVLPTVSITSPTDGTSMTTPTNVTIQAIASDSDGTIASVNFFDGTNPLGASTPPTYSVSADFYPGTHLLTAVATDNSGGSSTSAVVTVTVNSVIITNPIAARIPKGGLTIELQTVADGLAAPIGMAVPDDASGRMFVFDQEGRAWVVTASGRASTPLIDLRSRLVALGAYDERGLLGLATHTNFAASPLIYTFTSEPYSGPADFQTGLDASNNCQSVIAEWRISATNTNVVDPSSRREILRIDKPQFNHNGGAMHFGPDGMLYVMLGDGGQANDAGPGHVPGGNAQDLNRIWGKLIRIDVDGANSANGQYGIPSDNPFDGTNGLAEIWAYGLRNPFSFGFERGTGTLYLADVGQNKVEEVDIITKGGNYGWNIREGSFWFDGVGNVVTAPVRPVPPGLIDPIAVYDHDDGLAIVCGYVYHGSAIPALQGRFVFGDWGSFNAPSGRLFYLDANNSVNELRIGVEDRTLGLWLRGYGQGPDGELYIFCSRQLGPTGATGRMLKLVSAPDPLMMTSIAPANGTNITATWSGGTGPFALQKRSALTEPMWLDTTFTTQRTATVPLQGNAGFLRAFDAAHEPPIPLTVYMTGAAQRPIVSSPALGTGIFRLDGNTLSFDIGYAGLTAVATAAHIHGPTNTSGSVGVLIPLNAYNGGAWGTNGTLSGVILLTDAQRAMILAGQTYVNIHNATFPGGEIRGQIAPVNFQAALSSANGVPASGTGANGLANLSLVGNQLTFNLTYRGLSGVATASHIHGPTNTTGNAGVLVNLGAYNGGAYGSNGTLSGTVTLTPDQIGWVVDGLTYINFHTPNFPPGEMRGQIVPHSTGVPLTALLSGLAEHPALTNTAFGAATFSLEGDKLTFNLVYGGLSGPATASHIHGYTNTTAGAGVLINLAPFNGGGYGASGALSGSVLLTPAQRNGLLNGQTYVNFHTTANPSGEMRGQIAPVTMSASLSGVNEGFVPVITPGTGSGSFALVRDQLSLNVTYNGLLSPATASHIHGPASFFGSAGVLVPLNPYNGGAYGSSGALAGIAPLTVSQLLNVINGSTYVNFHTTNNTGGEIRGQIMR